MQELVYLLKVNEKVQKAVSDRLMAKKPPSHVRLATMAPLSNYGFPPGSEGALLGVLSDGLIVGADTGDAPVAFVPWQNVAYLADGTSLAAKGK